MIERGLLSEAAATLDARGSAYGSADRMFSLVARRWSHVLGTTVTPSQVVLCLIDLKLVRLIHDPRHRDSRVDIAGYAASRGRWANEMASAGI